MCGVQDRWMEPNPVGGWDAYIMSTVYGSGESDRVRGKKNLSGEEWCESQAEKIKKFQRGLWVRDRSYIEPGGVNSPPRWGWNIEIRTVLDKKEVGDGGKRAECSGVETRILGPEEIKSEGDFFSFHKRRG